MYAIIDVETTGGQARFERVTEIAIVLHDGRQVVDTYSTLLNPERSIPWNITQLTGIDDRMVANAPKFYEVARKIVEMTEGAVFVAHNVTFDYNFIREEFARLGFTFSRQQLCTVRLARKVFPGLPSYSLSNLKQHFGIRSDRAHRALDDTLATVTLFEHILAAQTGASTIKSLVNQGIRETKLPISITLERLHSIPEECGVYYLYDENKEVIYVGKSRNIRKRLFEHFSDPTAKGEKLRMGVADISYEVTGSELVALLLESAEIKRLQPRVNRAMRLKMYAGAIFTYTDAQGYQCFVAGKRTAKTAKNLEMVADFPKLDSAKMYLQNIVRMHELCYRLSHLDLSERACFHYSIKKCHGACIGIETPEVYNERVTTALSQLNKRLSGSFFLLDQGRTPNERAVIGVQDGNYLGYGFVDVTDGFSNAEDLLEALAPPPPDPDATRIIRAFAEAKSTLKKIMF